MSLPRPPRTITDDNAERRVGFELEFTGLSCDDIVGIVSDTFGGEPVAKTDFEHIVRDTEIGDVRVELDADFFKRRGRVLEDADASEVSDWERWSTDIFAAAAQLVVPWEIVTAPLSLSSIDKLDVLCATLRDAGAKGTRQSVFYAFGVHLNPELPDLSPATILCYLRAYFCLFDWLCEREYVDLSRKLTPYIDPFPTDYIARIINPSYAPTTDTLIDDYLGANPTRNRSLDMLPLFAHLDEQRVRASVDDPRIKSRPTLHYRLPNCDIDDGDWSVTRPWRDWLQVEHLAADEARLIDACQDLAAELDRFSPDISGSWAQRSQQWLTDLS